MSETSSRSSKTGRPLRAAKPRSAPPPPPDFARRGDGMTGMMRLFSSRSLLTTLPVAVALLGLVLVLAVTGQLPTSPAPVQAQTQPGVLVSNFGQPGVTFATSTAHSGIETSLATKFTTGSGASSGAYSLSSIAIKSHLDFATNTDGVLRAELWSAATTTAHNPPHKKLYDLTVPGTVPGGGNDVTFTAPSHATLATDTSYYLVVYTTDSTDFEMIQTASDGEDAASESGWSIQNDGAYSVRGSSPDAGSWVWNQYEETALIQVRGTEAATAVAVSNFGQTVLTGFNEATSTIGAFDSSQQYVVSTQFTTGAVTNTLASIAVKTPTGQATSTDGVLKAELWSASSSTGNPPDEKLYDLTVPDVSGGAQTVTFTAPPNATLAESAKHYLVVFTTDSTKFTMQVTNSDSEDAGSATGWSIADGAPWRMATGTPDAGTWAQDTHDSYGDTGLIQVSVYEAGEGSADPLALSALTAESSADGSSFTALTLNPAFDADTTTYRATVSNDVTHARLTPTLADSGSSVEVGKSDGTLSTVVRGSASDAIALEVGANDILVEVTDTNSNTRDYTVTVWRAAAGMLVSNLGQPSDNSYITEDYSVAQAFTTGAASGGYALGSIDAVNGTSGLTQSDRDTIRAELWSADTNGAPDSKVADLTVPAHPIAAGTVSFAAPANTTLTASTKYYAVFYTVGSLDVLFAATASDSEDAGSATGWSIANGARNVEVDEPTSATTWSSEFVDEALKIAVNASAEAPTPTPAGEPGPGDLDPEFSAASVVTTAVGSTSDVARAVAIQSDGKIVVAGYSHNGADNDFAVVRYTADGVLDTGFGTTSSGIVITDIGSNPDAAHSVAIQSDGKIVAAGSSSDGTDHDFAVVRYTAAGALDTSFGTGGKVTTAVGSNPDIALAVAIQSDGKIVAAGYSNNGTDNDFAVVRYTAAGALDTGFGTSGIASTTIGSYNDQARAVAIQSDGKVVAAGSSSNGSNDDFAVARYNANGSLDTSFDSDGYITTAIGSSNDVANAVAIQTDGKIVTAGYSNNGSDDDFALARYTTAGALDTTFSDDGKVTTGIGAGAERANAVAMRADGAILAAGYSYTGTVNDFALAAYDADGEPAAVLDGPGWLTTAIGTRYDKASAVAVDGDGNIVVAGYSNNGSDDDFALVRYDADGTPDTGFGASGIASTTIGSYDDRGLAVAIQSDDKVVVVGYGNNGSDDDFALVRYNADGTPDTGFGASGIASTTIGSYDDRGLAVAIQSDGKVVAAGYSNNGSDDDFTVVRYNTDGTLDTGFGTTTTGWLLTNIGSGDDRASAMEVQADGKIVVVGNSHNGSDDDFAVVRYNTDGTLDTGFGTSTSGIVTTGFGSGRDDVASSVAIQSDGKIVVAGHSIVSGQARIAVVRFNADGSLDTGFGTGGMVTTTIGSGHGTGSSVAIQPDGKVVVVGYGHNGSDNDFALVRYNADGSLDTGFGADSNGKVMTDFTSMEEQARAVAIQPDGNKIVVAVHSGNTTFAVARYLAGELVPSVSLSASPNPVEEGSSVTITATLSPALSSAVTIPLTLTPGTAGSGEYGTLASIAIASGQTTGTGTITTTADTEVEDDETFTVSLDEDNLPAGVVTGSTSSVEITIDDDDVPAAPTDLIGRSLNATELWLKWTRPVGFLSSIDVHYTSAPKTGSGAVADDAAVQTVSAAAGWVDTDPSLRIGDSTQYIDDLTTGTDYRVRVRANSPAGASDWAFDEFRFEAPVAVNLCVRVSAPRGGKPTISIDAGLPHGGISGWVAQVKGSADSWPVRDAFSHNWPTGATDYTSRSSDPCQQFVVEMPTPGATYDVRFHLTDRFSQVIEKSTDPVTVTVWDVPGKPAGVSATTGAGSGRLDVSWTAVTSTGFAGNDANVDGDFDDAVDDAPATITDYRVRWRVKDTDSTTAGDQPGAWSSGESAGADDTSHAVSGLTAGEEYQVQVRALNGVNPGSDWSDSADGTAGTDPILSSNADLSALTASSATGATGTYTALTLSPAFAATTTAYTATVGNTVSHVKLTPTVDDTGNATVAVGKQGATLTAVTDTQDSAAIELAVGANAITVRVTAEDSTTKDYTVTVTRQGPTVSLSASPNPVTEGSAVTITATLAASLSSDVAIPLTLTAGTAEAEDFGTLASITVSAGQTTGTGEITTNHDSGDSDETFTVALDTGNLPSAVLEGSPNSVLVTISDDEGIPAVSLSASPNPVNEGSRVTITATLSKTLSANVTIPLTLTAGTAESGDYGTLASITVSSGQTTGTGTISTNHDSGDSDETFTVAVDTGNLPSSVQAGSPSSVVVTITDDDKPSTNANLSALTASSSTSSSGSYTALALSPAFSSATTSYTATVESAVTHAKLTPTVEDRGRATVQVGKSGSLAAVSSGRASAAIALDDGANAIIVRVTAEDGNTTRDYTVTVTRAPRPMVSLSASPNPVRPEHDPDDPDVKKNTVTITATLSRPFPEVLWIPVTLDQDASNPDHSTISVIGISANSLTGTHVMNVREDRDTRDDTFTVALDTAKLPKEVAAGSPASVTVTIQDTDSKAAPGALPNFRVTPKVRYLELTWRKPAARTTHYEVQYKTAAAPNQAGSDGDPTTGWISLPRYANEDATTRRVTRLTSGTAYDVRARAMNDQAAGPWATGRGTPK